jgi:hypothetical protein
MAESLLPALHAVLDDTSGGAALIECGAALAHRLHRALTLVYVENTMALHAAALPQVQALAHTGATWQPFAAEDVERGWRAQTARLRVLASDIAQRHAVAWSLRTVRGAWPGAAIALFEETDLLLVGPQRTLPPSPARTVILIDDRSPAAARGRQLAADLAQALRATLQPWSWSEAIDAALVQRSRVAAACVMPRDMGTRGRLRLLSCPLLLVA